MPYILLYEGPVLLEYEYQMVIVIKSDAGAVALQLHNADDRLTRSASSPPLDYHSNASTALT